MQQLYREARDTVAGSTGGWENAIDWARRTRWQRKVSAEFGRRLRAMWILVEGE